MCKHRIAVVTVTRGGQQLAQKIKLKFKNVEIYSPERLSNPDLEINYFESSLTELTARLFTKYKKIIYIMSLGIVVRVIAPYLESKRVDPAVLTIDETAKNVISTLSGHLGGANELTELTAEILGANAVITTATDCQGKPAIDMLAKKLNCKIQPFENLKLANAAIVNDRPLNIFTDYNINLSGTDNIKIYPLSFLDSKSSYKEFTLIISNQKIKLEYKYLQLIPRNIVIGIGCRRGVSTEQIKMAVDKSLKLLNIDGKSIKNLATIDLKKDETGLLEYADKHSLAIDIIKREEINKADLNINKSKFVQRTVGVPGVCEPSALLSSNDGRLILAKTKYNKVTIAVVEEEVVYE